MKNFFTSRWGIGLVVVLVVVGGIVVVAQQDKGPRYETAQVEVADLVQEVSVTGRVKSADVVDLTFEISGKVQSVLLDVGQRVGVGQVVVRLDNTELQAELAEAKANLDVQVAELAELETGTRIEEIEAAEKNLANVQAKAEADIEEDYAAALTSAQKAAQAAKNALLVLTDIQFVHFLGNDQNSADLKDAKSKAALALFTETNGGGLNNETLNELKGGVFGRVQALQTTDRQGIDASLKDVLAALEATRDALKAVPLTTDVTSSQRTNLATEKSAIDSEIVTVSAKQQAIAVQKAQNASAISTAAEDLRLKKAGSTTEEIDSEKARVRAAEAAVQTAQARVAKTQIASPLRGVITKQEAKVGEFVQAGDILVGVISENEFEIETNVPEADIAKVAIGNTASLTLDAYGESAVFEASVSEIDPAETIIEGVPTYKVTLHFTKEDSRIRSGMTANIDIITAQKDNVLVVPTRAVLDKEGAKIVRVLKDSNIPEEVEVVVGLRGSDGNIEIQQGLEQGQEIVTFVHD